VAATQREAGNTGRRNNTGRHGQSESMTRVIQIALCATGPRMHNAVSRIDPHALHQREINDEPVIAAPQTRPVVASPAYCDEKIILSTKPNRTAEMTSATSAQRAIISGRLSIMPLYSLRTVS
jgi:hypothetical protein